MLKPFLTLSLVATLIVLTACTLTPAPAHVTEPPTAPPATQPAPKPTPAELVPRITVEELLEKIEGGAGIVIVDTRPKAEYDAGHIKGAISAPLSIILEGKWLPPATKEIVFY